MIRTLLVTASLSCSVLAAAAAGDLTVTIGGTRNANGAVALALFNSETSFPRAPLAFASARIKAAQANAGFTFHNLAPGKYAVSAFHDENDNGKLDTDAVGFPTEGFGFSNDARGTLGPPAFAKAAFELGEDKMSVAVQVKY
jgi:uncharacterized protein (DUF2141 family)